MSDEVKDPKDILICRCEEVTLREIEQAIDEGFDTVSDVKKDNQGWYGTLSRTFLQ